MLLLRRFILEGGCQFAMGWGRGWTDEGYIITGDELYAND